MYLKRLELQGFKSFADKSVLEFKPGITSVIGPNGSGKSNISDSIRWVLGEQSMKSLRSSKAEDIIFAGTQARKSLGFAEASIVIDNTDGSLPIEYSEVTITRKIYRSGETGYFINKVPCRLKDVLELFMDTGIGKDGYSIIGQGKIDEILSNKSEDRRHIFEEAAGIVKYRTRKQESEKKLEQTKLNLLRINDILSEIEASIEPLKVQSEKARQFLDLREELKNIEVGVFAVNIEGFKEKLKKITEDMTILEEQKGQEDEKMTKIGEEKEALRAEINQIINEIEKMQNSGFESSNQIEKLQAEISIHQEKIQNNEQNEKRLLDEIKQNEDRMKELQEEKEQKNEKKTNLSQNKEKFQKELEEKEAKLAELSQGLSEKEKEIEEKKQAIEQDTDHKYEVLNDIHSCEIYSENLDKKKASNQSEIQATISELDAKRDEKQELGKTFYEIEARRNKTASELDELNKKREEIHQKTKEYDKQQVEWTETYRMKNTRQKFLVETEKEKEGYVKSVKALLQECEKNGSLKEGVHGVLANLLTVPKEYETAIEMALGQAVQNIVTDKEADAKKLVEYLRANNLGRASFLPIASVHGKKLERFSQEKDGKVIGIASDLIQYEKKYEQIVFSLLGRTVIVEDMDTAISLAKKNQYAFRIVTLKGDFINPSGSITGGSVMNKTVNILGRSREIEELGKQMEELQAKIKQVEKERADFLDLNSSIEEEAQSLEASLQESDIIYATEKQKMVAIEENIARLETRLEKLRGENQDIEKQKAEKAEEKADLETVVQELEKQMQAYTAEIQKFAEANQDRQKYIDDLNFDITNLKISVSSFDESQLSIDEILERIEQEMQTNRVAMENKQKRVAEGRNENETYQNAILSFQEQIEKVKEDAKNSSTKVEELKTLRMQKNEKLDKIDQEVTSQFEVIESLKEQIVKTDVKKTKMEQDLQDTINSLWEEYELTPSQIQEVEKPENLANAQKEVATLKEQIRNLGSINIDSIEEYKKTKERYDFMCEQRLDLENTATKLRQVINQMTDTMKEQFREKFKLINQNFNEVFVELFGGGKAELILEDEEHILECGIDIRVQPTGKKLQNMMLLSGGEKALTAIAILFAILKLSPAPFCILDEIEAALDDVNVYRFAEYLRKFSEETQFLVITHRKGTMEIADSVYGVTMEENGISKLLSIRLKQ